MIRTIYWREEQGDDQEVQRKQGVKERRELMSWSRYGSYNSLVRRARMGLMSESGYGSSSMPGQSGGDGQEIEELVGGELGKGRGNQESDVIHTLGSREG